MSVGGIRIQFSMATWKVTGGLAASLFQATQRISSRGWDLAPGVIGVLSLFTSQIYSSDSDPPANNTNSSIYV